MADANPSRPVPQRKIVDGKVETPEGAEVETADAPKVGQYNERGAKIANVGKMWKSGAVRVDYA